MKTLVVNLLITCLLLTSSPVLANEDVDISESGVARDFNSQRAQEVVSGFNANVSNKTTNQYNNYLDTNSTNYINYLNSYLTGVLMPLMCKSPLINAGSPDDMDGVSPVLNLDNQIFVTTSLNAYMIDYYIYAEILALKNRIAATTFEESGANTRQAYPLIMQKQSIELLIKMLKLKSLSVHATEAGWKYSSLVSYLIYAIKIGIIYIAGIAGIAGGVATGAAVGVTVATGGTAGVALVAALGAALGTTIAMLVPLIINSVSQLGNLNTVQNAEVRGENVYWKPTDSNGNSQDQINVPIAAMGLALGIATVNDSCDQMSNFLKGAQGLLLQPRPEPQQNDNANETAEPSEVAPHEVFNVEGFDTSSNVPRVPPQNVPSTINNTQPAPTGSPVPVVPPPQPPGNNGAPVINPGSGFINFKLEFEKVVLKKNSIKKYFDKKIEQEMEEILNKVFPLAYAQENFPGTENFLDPFADYKAFNDSEQRLKDIRNSEEVIQEKFPKDLSNTRAWGEINKQFADVNFLVSFLGYLGFRNGGEIKYVQDLMFVSDTFILPMRSVQLSISSVVVNTLFLGAIFPEYYRSVQSMIAALFAYGFRKEINEYIVKLEEASIKLDALIAELNQKSADTSPSFAGGSSQTGSAPSTPLEAQEVAICLSDTFNAASAAPCSEIKNPAQLPENFFENEETKGFFNIPEIAGINAGGDLIRINNSLSRGDIKSAKKNMEALAAKNSAITKKIDGLINLIRQKKPEEKIDEKLRASEKEAATAIGAAFLNAGANPRDLFARGSSGLSSLGLSSPSEEKVAAKKESGTQVAAFNPASLKIDNPFKNSAPSYGNNNELTSYTEADVKAAMKNSYHYGEGENDINENKDSDLFKAITLRYFKSAYPHFFKRTQTSEKEEAKK